MEAFFSFFSLINSFLKENNAPHTLYLLYYWYVPSLTYLWRMCLYALIFICQHLRVNLLNLFSFRQSLRIFWRSSFLWKSFESLLIYENLLNLFLFMIISMQILFIHENYFYFLCENYFLFKRTFLFNANFFSPVCVCMDVKKSKVFIILFRLKTMSNVLLMQIFIAIIILQYANQYFNRLFAKRVRIPWDVLSPVKSPRRGKFSTS